MERATVAGPSFLVDRRARRDRDRRRRARRIGPGPGAGQARTSGGDRRPHASYPPDFRCEKLCGEQLALIEALGVADALAALPAPPGARRSPWSADFVTTSWSTPCAVFGPRRSGSSTIAPGASSRGPSAGGSNWLAVRRSRLVSSSLAAGPSPYFRQTLGLRRHVLSERHSSASASASLSRRRGAAALRGPGAAWSERRRRGGLRELLPVGEAMRVNLFLYHDPRSETVRRLRADPIGGLIELIPSLGELLGQAELASPTEVRSTDLCRTRADLRPGW